MATAKDFSKLGTLDGVLQYILVRDDGFVVSKNYDDAVALSSAIITSGQYCDSLDDDFDAGRYVYCSIERQSGENVLIFSLGRYYLAIIKHADSEPQQLADTVINFLKTLS